MFFLNKCIAIVFSVIDYIEKIENCFRIIFYKNMDMILILLYFCILFHRSSLTIHVNFGTVLIVV